MTKHIVNYSTYCHSTQREEVFAFCGYSEEASGSGKHTVDVGETPCEECYKRWAVFNKTEQVFWE